MSTAATPPTYVPKLAGPRTKKPKYLAHTYETSSVRLQAPALIKRPTERAEGVGPPKAYFPKNRLILPLTMAIKRPGHLSRFKYSQGTSKPKANPDTCTRSNRGTKPIPKYTGITAAVIGGQRNEILLGKQAVVEGALGKANK